MFRNNECNRNFPVILVATFSNLLGLLLKPRSPLSRLLYERRSVTKLGRMEWGLKRLENIGSCGRGAVGSLKMYYIESIVDGKDPLSYKWFFTCDDDAHACERLSS